MSVCVPKHQKRFTSQWCWHFFTEEAKFWEAMPLVPASLVFKTNLSRHWPLLPNWITKYINVLQHQFEEKPRKLIVSRLVHMRTSILITHKQIEFGPFHDLSPASTFDSTQLAPKRFWIIYECQVISSVGCAHVLVVLFVSLAITAEACIQ